MQINLEKQRSFGDCAIAAVASITRLPYEQILARATSLGFNIENPKMFGIGAGRLFNEVISSYNYNSYTSHYPVYFPCIVSVKSINLPDVYHAIVLYIHDNHIRIHDPTTHVMIDSLKYVYENMREAYFSPQIKGD